MNSEWQDFLVMAGGRMSENADNGAVEFELKDESASGNALCALTTDVVLRVSGDDAESFLQGQFSNDIAALGNLSGATASQLSTWSSPKGRVLTLFRIIKTAQGDFLMQLSADLVESVQKRLQMYVMRAKVKIELDTELQCIGVSGDQACAMLESIVGKLPASVDDCVEQNGVVLTRTRGVAPRVEIIAPLDQSRQIWEQLAPVSQQSGDQLWRLQNIDAGVPSIRAATSEAFVLQMLNLHHLNGVSFKKGCFPGQEVVARMQYLGKLKRRMFLASQVSAEVPDAGAELFNEGVSSAVGKIVDAQHDNANSGNQVRLLAVVAIEAANKPLFTDREASQPLDLLELPYSLEES